MKTKRTRKITLFVGGLLSLCICSVIAVALFGDTDDTGEPPVAVIEDTAVPATPIPEPTEPDFLTRCIPASVGQTDRIQDGVIEIDPGNYITVAYAVKSNDFELVYFVAAFIYGTGMEDGTGPGIWAISGELETPKLTFSVDGFANSFSVWPDVAGTTIEMTQFDDGAQEAKQCAEFYKP